VYVDYRYSKITTDKKSLYDLAIFSSYMMRIDPVICVLLAALKFYLYPEGVTTKVLVLMFSGDIDVFPHIWQKRMMLRETTR
jgi:hypothetical protein